MTKCCGWLAAGLILIPTAAGRAEELVGAAPVAGDGGAAKVGSLLSTVWRSCWGGKPEAVAPTPAGDYKWAPQSEGVLGALWRPYAGYKEPFPTTTPSVWSPVAHEAPAAKPMPHEVQAPTPAAPPVCCEAPKRAGLLSGWGQRLCGGCGTPGCQHWTVEKSTCFGRLYEWLTYRPITAPCPCSNCKQCSPCCTPDLYTFFLCDHCGAGCGAGGHAPLLAPGAAAPPPAAPPLPAE